MRTVLVLAALTTFAACGEDAENQQKKENLAVNLQDQQNEPDQEKKADSNEEPKTFTETELMFLAGSTVENSQKAYAHCKEVLANGIYTRDSSRVSEKARYALKQEYCSLDEGEFANKFYNFLKTSHAEATGNQRSGKVGGSYKLISLDVEGALNTTKSMSDEEMRAYASEQTRKWKKETCTNLDKSGSNSFVHEVLSEKVDPGIVKAWQSCVAKENKGFFCSSHSEKDLISVTLKWIPNDIQKKLLPRVNIDLTATYNLEMITKEAPTVLGTGSGKVISFRKTDRSDGSLLDFEAKDAGDQVSFACSINMGPISEGEFKEDPSCGIEEAVEGTGQVCGVKHHNRGFGPVCGNPIYIKRRSPECGVEAYKIAPNSACPGSSAEKKGDFKFGGDCHPINPKLTGGCPAGYKWLNFKEIKMCPIQIGAVSGGGFKSGFMHCKKPAVVKSCMHKSNGVQRYKSCRHKSHGIERYPSCVHQSFGSVYKTCKDRSFGVKKYKRCFVRN